MLTRGQKFFLFFLLLLGQTLLASGMGIVFTPLPTKDKIAPGVKVAGIPVGNLTKEQAAAKLARPFSSPPSFSLAFSWEGRTWTYQAADIKASYDVAAAAARAYDVGRKGGKLKRHWETFLARTGNINLAPPLTFDRNQARKLLTKIAAEVNQPPADAKLILQKEKLQLLPERTGKKVDVAKSLALLTKTLQREARNVRVPLVITRVKPSITTADLKQVDDLLAVAVTPLKENASRTANVARAASALNGILLLPGRVFSFNSCLGPATAERGYQPAPVIDGTQTATADGGGICQVSSSLFRAALLAGLEIVERHPHTRPVDYIPPGQDAAIVYGQKDLKIKNTTSWPVVIFAAVEKDQLIVRLYGHQADPETKIELVTSEPLPLEPQIITKKDPSLPAGNTVVLQQGQKGYQVALYRLWYRQNKVIRKELVAETRYEPVATIVAVGTKPPLPESVSK